MQTLSQKVTDTLRDGILSGRFEPGAKLEEIPVSEMLGVSRTPVRAALATLVNEGLINYRAKSGYSVRGFKADEILAAYEVRAVLEGLACRSAARRGLSEEQIGELARQLAVGDRILRAGQLMEEDHAPYQQMNMVFHKVILEASGNPWVQRFAEQAHNIPYASDRIMLWTDHAVIKRSHDDHRRIFSAIVERDASRAEAIMREHVYYAGVILRDVLLADKERKTA